MFGCKIQYWFLLPYTYEYLWQLSILTKLAFFSKFYTLSSTSISIYRVSQEEWTKLRESVPHVELYRYNPKQLYPKLNGYGDNGHWKVWASGVSTYCTPSVTPYSSTAHARQETPLTNIAMQWPWRAHASAVACIKCLVTLRTSMTWVRVFL